MSSRNITASAILPTHVGWLARDRRPTWLSTDQRSPKALSEPCSGKPRSRKDYQKKIPKQNYAYNRAHSNPNPEKTKRSWSVELALCFVPKAVLSKESKPFL